MSGVRAVSARRDGAVSAVDRDAVAIKAIARVFGAWRLTGEVSARLSAVSDRTWLRMRSGTWTGKLSQDQTMRASALVGLYKGLHLYFGDDLADEWVSLDNRGHLFQGRSPVDHMLAGGLPAIMGVREYVDALRSGL